MRSLPGLSTAKEFTRMFLDSYSDPGREWSDYQLRLNFPILMAVAPELFDPVHTLGTLRLADKHLRR